MPGAGFGTEFFPVIIGGGKNGNGSADNPIEITWDDFKVINWGLFGAGTYVVITDWGVLARHDGIRFVQMSPTLPISTWAERPVPNSKWDGWRIAISDFNCPCARFNGVDWVGDAPFIFHRSPVHQLTGTLTETIIVEPKLPVALLGDGFITYKMGRNPTSSSTTLRVRVSTLSNVLTGSPATEITGTQSLRLSKEITRFSASLTGYAGSASTITTSTTPPVAGLIAGTFTDMIYMAVTGRLTDTANILQLSDLIFEANPR